MDPNETLYLILRGLQKERDREETVWALYGLAHWIERNGFLPDPHVAIQRFLSMFPPEASK